MASSEYNLSVTEVSGPYKLSVTDGTELTLSVNAGLQGPAGPAGPSGPAGADGPAGAAGPAGADGADALWNFRGEFGGGYIRITGELYDNYGDYVVFPDMFYSGNLGGKPSYTSNNSICYWQTNRWFLYFKNGDVTAGSWESTSNVASPELATNWTTISSSSGIPVIALFSGSGSYEVGDVVTYRGSTWYCLTAFTFNPALPQYPDFSPDYWELIAAKGEVGPAGPDGPAGVDGVNGVDGVDGVDGADALWNYTGAYDVGASYAVGDVATYNGETFYRTDAHGGNTGDTPFDGSPYWGLLAAKGQDGLNSVTTSTTTDLTGFISGNGTTISGATAGTSNPTASTIAIRDSGGRLHATQLRLHGATYYSQINFAPNPTENISFDLPNSSGVIATNNTAVMLSGEQTVAGAKTFSGQMELTSQAATNATSALTRALGDSRYESKSYVGIKVENVDSVSNTPIKLTSVTLPIGTYHLETHTAGFASNTPNGGLSFGLRSNQSIRTSLASYISRDSDFVYMGHVTSDSLTYSKGDVLGTTGSRNLNGIIEVIVNNTEVSIEFSQMTTFPSLASTSRKRSFIIATKIA
jgi:hypothetical protein